MRCIPIVNIRNDYLNLQDTDTRIKRSRRRPRSVTFENLSRLRDIGRKEGTELVKKRRFKAMNWIQRKIYMYNVTFGMYMLDRWERYLFNILVIILLWFVFYNGSRSAAEFYKSYLKVQLGIGE
ncbi:uncharacterized protein LOC122071744 [Macadamia integrifolia]|uniref:uncharacterized protein LOC122071744 n=1 Tax=Macadamia integrifolia TaxID=60698 RepID=UPI001C4E6B01|nr:uncharacterized protein LOC122071744 [Macadamia integrifolia]